jgi:hypothetical protein
VASTRVCWAFAVAAIKNIPARVNSRRIRLSYLPMNPRDRF